MGAKFRQMFLRVRILRTPKASVCVRPVYAMIFGRYLTGLDGVLDANAIHLPSPLDHDTAPTRV